MKSNSRRARLPDDRQGRVMDRPTRRVRRKISPDTRAGMYENWDWVRNRRAMAYLAHRRANDLGYVRPIDRETDRDPTINARHHPMRDPAIRWLGILEGTFRIDSEKRYQRYLLKPWRFWRDFAYGEGVEFRQTVNKAESGEEVVNLPKGDTTEPVPLRQIGGDPVIETISQAYMEMVSTTMDELRRRARRLVDRPDGYVRFCAIARRLARTEGGPTIGLFSGFTTVPSAVLAEIWLEELSRRYKRIPARHTGVSFTKD
jgi:hypothetical protein